MAILHLPNVLRSRFARNAWVFSWAIFSLFRKLTLTFLYLHAMYLIKSSTEIGLLPCFVIDAHTRRNRMENLVDNMVRSNRMFLHIAQQHDFATCKVILGWGLMKWLDDQKLNSFYRGVHLWNVSHFLCQLLLIRMFWNSK